MRPEHRRGCARASEIDTGDQLPVEDMRFPLRGIEWAMENAELVYGDPASPR
jgi:hypothetical protein